MRAVVAYSTLWVTSRKCEVQVFVILRAQSGGNDSLD